MNDFAIISNYGMSRVEQVAASIKREIERGRLRRHDRLPSINDFSEKHIVARDTVEKAYKQLKTQGLISSIPGNGYFVIGKQHQKVNILLILNKLSDFKKDVYNSFIETLGTTAKVDLRLHHYNLEECQEIIESNLGQYHYYAIMPHFKYAVKQRSIIKVLNLVPEQELIILDKYLEPFRGACTQVYQDFENDIYDALVSGKEALSKYKQLVIILKKDAYHPLEIVQGARKYCERFHKKLKVISSTEGVKLAKGSVYIETSDSDLAELIRAANKANLKMGKDIGIISFNETILKGILGITVMTTDFAAMGKTAALSILDDKTIQVKNPFHLIQRSSL